MTHKSLFLTENTCSPLMLMWLQMPMSTHTFSVWVCVLQQVTSVSVPMLYTNYFLNELNSPSFLFSQGQFPLMFLIVQQPCEAG